MENNAVELLGRAQFHRHRCHEATTMLQQD